MTSLRDGHCAIVSMLLMVVMSGLGCVHTGYLVDQGVGQLKLITRGDSLQEALDNPQVKARDKQKIRLIQKAKDYFYQYWKKEPTAIYSKVIFLERDAVSYLVVASPFERIEARKECFPIAGCFPYLGFFNRQKAHAYAAGLQKQNFETYIRPVHAYSTLGHFNDRILSSFFQYGDYELVDLVFHELFHTLFFAKGEVDFNENLASYFAGEMALEYFQLDTEQKLARKEERKKQQKISGLVASLAQTLDRLYRKHTSLSKPKALQLRRDFMQQTFFPQVKKECAKLKPRACFPLERQWNNASLAAFLTYQSEQSRLAGLQKKLNLGLRDFFDYVERRYLEYQKGTKEQPFADFLLQVIQPLEKRHGQTGQVFKKDHFLFKK